MRILTVVALLGMVSVASACRDGFVPSDVPGVCMEGKPVEVTNPAWVSDEKPPTDKLPSYQREGVNVVTEPPGREVGSDTAHDYQAESNGK